MSISDEIRTVLRSAHGPLTAREIREGDSEDDYSSEQIGGALFAMHKAGELVRDGEGRGKFTYMLDSKSAPPRGVKSEAAEPIASPPLKPKPAKHNGHAVAPAPLPMPQPKIATATVTRPHVSLPLAELRTIVFALIARHPDPMPDELRKAVVGAIQSTL